MVLRKLAPVVIGLALGLGAAGVAEAQGFGAYGGYGGAYGVSAPIYGLGRATVFLNDAEVTARTLFQEQATGIRAPRRIAHRTVRLVQMIERARADLILVDREAMATNPQAIPAIRLAIADLNAADAAARQAAVTVAGGYYGATIQIALGSAAQHLAAARRAVFVAQRAYGAGYAPGYGGYGIGYGGVAPWYGGLGYGRAY